MAIRPCRLDSITAHTGKADQLKRFRRQRLFGIFIEVAHDVCLALAARARTRPPQLFQGNKTFPAVRPFDRQFVPDLLDVVWSHNLKLSRAPAIRPLLPTLIDSIPRSANLHAR